MSDGARAYQTKVVGESDTDQATLPCLPHFHTGSLRHGMRAWAVPPAALCVHLCIGQAYAFSVFNLPMTKLIGINDSAPDD